MFNKCCVITCLVFLLTDTSYGNTAPLKIVGFNGGSLSFKYYEEKYGGWNDVQYQGSTDGFSIYSLPTQLAGYENGVVASSDIGLVSGDKKYVIVQRTNPGEVVDGEGSEIVSSPVYCDMVSLETGCVENVGSVQQCDGAWLDNKWKSAEGGVFEFSNGGISPKQLISDVVGVSENESRASALRDSVFMGIASYMACYPPEKNISEYNDIAFYFAQGGEHLLAMQIYNRLLAVAADRVPLKLNVADSLWVLGKHDEAKPYYAEYRKAMRKKGVASKVPKRVEERLN